MIMACAMLKNPSRDKWWPMIACMEKGDAVQRASQCAQSSGLDYNEIKTCTTSQEGMDEMTRIGKATQGLQPPHRWTPWVVVDGAPLSSSQLGQSLTKIICNAYKGADKPPACGRAIELDMRDDGF